MSAGSLKLSTAGSGAAQAEAANEAAAITPISRAFMAKAYRAGLHSATGAARQWRFATARRAGPVAVGAKQRQRRAAGIVATSVLAHVAVFAVLFSHFGSAPSYAVAPVMSVQLLTRPPAPRPPPNDSLPRRRGAAS